LVNFSTLSTTTLTAPSALTW